MNREQWMKVKQDFVNANESAFQDHADPEVNSLLMFLRIAEEQRFLEGSIIIPASEALVEDTDSFVAMDSTHELPPVEPENEAVVATSISPKETEIGRYRIQRVIGKGGFANVYLARDPNLNALVALKVSKKPLTSYPEKERFLNEARHLFDLDHPNIVRVYNADITDEGKAYIAMKFIDGPNLRKHLKKASPLGVAEVIRILVPVAEAIAKAHANNIVHRDLKPANVLLASDGTPMVGDFGLAIRDDAPHRRGEYAGTTPYMSPEQVTRQSDNLHGATDIWALGVILYEALTGQKPFHGDGEDLHTAIIQKTPKRPREIRDEIPLILEQLCLTCLAKNPRDRPGSARDVAKILRKANGLQARRVVLVGTMSLVSLAGIATVVGLRRLNKSLANVETLANPGHPYSLLGQEPRVISSHTHRQPSVSQTQPNGPISVDSSGLALVELARTDRSSFHLEFAFEKNAWSGEVGVFWGHQSIVHEGKMCFCANAVVIHLEQERTGQEIVYMTTHKWIMEPRGQGYYSTRDTGSHHTKIPLKYWLRKDRIVEIIRLAVDAKEQVNVHWQGRQVALPKRLFGSNSGSVGLTNRNGASTLVRAQILFPVDTDTEN